MRKNSAHPRKTRRNPVGIVAAIALVGSLGFSSSMVSADENSEPQEDDQAEYVDDRLVVLSDGDLDAVVDELGDLLEGASFKKSEKLGAIIIDDVDEELLSDIEMVEGVKLVEKDPIVRALGVTPNDPDFINQTGLVRSGINQVWETTTGDEIVVAVLDTGVNEILELQGRVLDGANFTDDPDFDADGHGTLTSAVIAAEGDNEFGIAGVCWSCLILPVKVLSDEGTGPLSGLADGIVWAADNGADIINMSLGGELGAALLEEAVEYAAEAGVVMVASAGNDGEEFADYPAAYDAVISVAGHDDSGNRSVWNEESSSNFGAGEVDISAPGCNRAMDDDTEPFLYCGTSSAAPVVAGLIALGLSLDVPVDDTEDGDIEDGEDGENGEDGEDGENGEDGEEIILLSPSLGSEEDAAEKFSAEDVIFALLSSSVENGFTTFGEIDAPGMMNALLGLEEEELVGSPEIVWPPTVSVTQNDDTENPFLMSINGNIGSACAAETALGPDLLMTVTKPGADNVHVTELSFSPLGVFSVVELYDISGPFSITFELEEVSEDCELEELTATLLRGLGWESNEELKVTSTVNESFERLVAAAGLSNDGSPLTHTVCVGELPEGVTLSSGGILSGTPTSVSTTNFTVCASNGDITIERAMSLTVSSPSGDTKPPESTIPQTGGGDFMGGWMLAGLFLLLGAASVMVARRQISSDPSKKGVSV